jgi:hypothetical protein
MWLNLVFYQNLNTNLKHFLVGSPDISESSDLEQFDPTGHLPGKII